MIKFLWLCMLIFAASSLSSCATGVPQKELVFKNASKAQLKDIVTKNLLRKPDAIQTKNEGDELTFDRHDWDTTQGQRLIWRFTQSGKDVRVMIRCFHIFEFGENEKVVETSDSKICEEYLRKLWFEGYEYSLQNRKN